MWCIQQPSARREIHAAMPAWQTHGPMIPDGKTDAILAGEISAAAFPVQGCPTGDASVLLRTQCLAADDADVRAARTAVTLLPALEPPRGNVSPLWACTPVVACSDRAPVCSHIPGVEAGRAVFVTGDPQHALGLSATVADLLRCVAPSDIHLMHALSMHRKSFSDAAASSEQKLREDAQHSGDDLESPPSATDDGDTFSLVQGRAKRNVGAVETDVVFVPRAPRRGRGA